MTFLGGLKFEKTNFTSQLQKEQFKPRPIKNKIVTPIKVIRFS